MDRSSFEFQKVCFLCGEECIVDVNPKHRDIFERNPRVMCKTADRGRSKHGKQRKSFKEVVEEVRSYIIYRCLSRSKNHQSSQVQEKRGEKYSDDSFITFVLKICDERGDIRADKVWVRIQGAVSDIHAADAR